MNISATKKADHNKILSEALLGWGKAVLGFELDQIGTLVSMAPDSSHRVVMGKILLARYIASAFIFDWIFFILAGDKDNHNILDEFEFRPDLIKDCGVSCICASEKIPIDL